MKTYTLKICSGVVIGGKIHRRGDEVDGVSEKLALQLLRRGKAEPAVIYDALPESDVGGIVNGTDKDPHGAPDEADGPEQPAAEASTRAKRGRKAEV